LLPLAVLEPDEKLLVLLEGVGVETCGELAALDREAVEVRFGAEAVRLWRWSRGDDERRLFRPPPRETPQASLDFVDYVVTDPERLLFTANALLTNVCEALTETGAHTRRMTLTLSLANGERWTRSIGAARATASRTTWLRRVRSELERLTVPDAVTGVTVAAETADGAGAVQGDLFDAGFATAASVDDALERLVEVQGQVLVEPQGNGHPLAERRSTFAPAERSIARGRSPWRGEAKGWRRRRDSPERTSRPADERAPLVAAGFTLQLLPEPRRVLVETIVRRDHIVPVRYRDGTWRALLTAAGPERISGGQWESAFAREYYRCVDGNGLLVWIYRDGRDGEWYLHGWWD
jgi:protein ImuB